MRTACTISLTDTVRVVVSCSGDTAHSRTPYRTPELQHLCAEHWKMYTMHCVSLIFTPKFSIYYCKGFTVQMRQVDILTLLYRQEENALELKGR